MFDASLPLLLSLLLRVLGAVLSLFLLQQVGDRRFVFFSGLLSLMALRQALTVVDAPPGLREVPGFIVSIFTVVLVLYLLQYVRQEAALKERMKTVNEELRENEDRLQAVLLYAGLLLRLRPPTWARNGVCVSAFGRIVARCSSHRCSPRSPHIRTSGT